MISFLRALGHIFKSASACRNVTVPPIQHFHRQRPESYCVGDARDPDSDSVSSSSSERDSPRAAASQAGYITQACLLASLKAEAPVILSSK